MTETTARTPAGRATATVLEAVRRAILTGDLAPGEQVRQQVWADRIGVSRPPLREALEILTNEGLLTHGLNQGYFVAKFSVDEMEQLYTMRLLLEREALKRMSWPDAAQLEAFELLVAEIAEYATNGRPDIAMSRLVDLYLGIYRLSRRKLIVEEIERLWMRTAVYRSRSHDPMDAPAASSSRHGHFIDALRARDADRLAELMLQPTSRGLRSAGGTDPASADTMG